MRAKIAAKVHARLLLAWSSRCFRRSRACSRRSRSSCVSTRFGASSRSRRRRSAYNNRMCIISKDD